MEFLEIAYFQEKSHALILTPNSPIFKPCHLHISTSLGSPLFPASNLSLSQHLLRLKDLLGIPWSSIFYARRRVCVRKCLFACCLLLHWTGFYEIGLYVCFIYQCVICKHAFLQSLLSNLCILRQFVVTFA